MLGITVDSREKRPLLFPSHLPVLQGHPSCRRSTRIVPVSVAVATLGTGDYAADGSPVVVERKGSLQEIHGNCLTGDRDRFLRALDRLAKAPRPYVLLEGTPAELLAPTAHVPSPHLAVDAFLRDLSERNIPLLVMPTRTMDQRRAAGEFLARLFWHSMGAAVQSEATPEECPACG